jgi:hypothetical protein
MRVNRKLNHKWMERIYLNMEVNTDNPAAEPGKAAA